MGNYTICSCYRRSKEETFLFPIKTYNRYEKYELKKLLLIQKRVKKFIAKVRSEKKTNAASLNDDNIINNCFLNCQNKEKKGIVKENSVIIIDTETNKGIQKYFSGAIYFGYFENEVKEGFGCYKEKNGNYCYGEFSNGQLNGIGIEYYIEGGRYEGEYLKGKKCGIGTYYLANFEKYEGQWKDNMLVKGYFYKSDGSYFVGSFKNNLYNGFGFVISDEEIIFGKYNCGVKNGVFLVQNKINGVITVSYYNEGELIGAYKEMTENETKTFIFIGSQKREVSEDIAMKIYKNFSSESYVKKIYRENYSNLYNFFLSIKQ